MFKKRQDGSGYLSLYGEGYFEREFRVGPAIEAIIEPILGTANQKVEIGHVAVKIPHNGSGNVPWIRCVKISESRQRANVCPGGRSLLRRLPARQILHGGLPGAIQDSHTRMRSNKHTNPGFP